MTTQMLPSTSEVPSEDEDRHQDRVAREPVGAIDEELGREGRVLPGQAPSLTRSPRRIYLNRVRVAFGRHRALPAHPKVAWPSIRFLVVFDVPPPVRDSHSRHRACPAHQEKRARPFGRALPVRGLEGIS